jgi:predicted N-acyltransferase
VGSIADVPAEAWDALDHGPSPFLRHGMLRALEESQSIGRGTGWQPAYLLAERGGTLVGAVAAFVKTHSYGEYIFDWGWANAAQRAGLRYYPKLVVAAPATPATGTRILLAPGERAATEPLVAAVRALADAESCSSIHWLFCTAEEQRTLARAGFFARASFQFHWHNRGYRGFDEFLGALKSRKRKQVRKERERAAAAIQRLDWVDGQDLAEAQLDDLDRFYRRTVDEHGGRDYLRPGFFHLLAKHLPDAMRVVEVSVGGRRVAGALFLETAHALYGRYWGCDVDIDCLHFETAYYAGIDRAIARGLPLFEAGAQGEHKLLRGFVPAPTYSAHWIRHAGLNAAVEDHCKLEAIEVAATLRELAKYGPYRDASDAASALDA